MLVFMHLDHRIRADQWLDAVNEYNLKAPASLKIYWAGSTDEENIRVSGGKGKRLNFSPAYKDIMQKDSTYFEWTHPLKNLESKLAAPYVNPSDSSKRNPKRTYETMNVNEIYRNMGVDRNEASPPCKRARSPVCYDTETEDEDDVDSDEDVEVSPRPCRRVREPEDEALLVTNGPPSAPGDAQHRLLPYAEALALPQVVRVVALAPGEVPDDSIPMAYALDAMGQRIEAQAPPPAVVEPQAPPPAVVEPQPEPVEPQPEPVTEEPQPEPVTEEPKPEPVTEEPKPEPVVEELKPESPCGPQPEPQLKIAKPRQPPLPPNPPPNPLGPRGSGDLVSLSTLNAVLQPLFSTVQYLSTSALASKDRTIAMLAHQLGVPVPPS